VFGVLTTAHVHSLTTGQIAALSPFQVEALTTTNLAAFTTAQQAALTTADLAALSPAQLDALDMATPIVLDFGGLGVSTVASAQGTSFDINATGSTAQHGWVSATSGLLAIDRNGDGLVNNGSELFGSGTTLANGQHAVNGYQALAELDLNHDSRITAADAGFSQLKVWLDRNGDGKTDAGELLGLADLGIVELGLAASSSSATDHGNLVGLISDYKTADGVSHQMADVWFSKTGVAAAATTEATPSVSLSDLLISPAHELFAGDGSHPAATAVDAKTSATTAAWLATGSSSAEDELHQARYLLV